MTKSSKKKLAQDMLPEIVAPTQTMLLLGILAIWVATALAYSNSFTIAFQFDDTHTVQSNMYIRSLKYIPRYFIDSTTYSYRPENSGYRPMTSVALALGFALSRLDTWGYHLIKLIEHSIVATLILLLGLRLLPRTGSAAPYRFSISLFAAMIFGVHRVNTETVDYICAVSTLQAGLFHVLAFLLYLKARESKDYKRHIGLIAISVVSYMCSMWSKEEGITLPAVIFAYEWIYERKEDEGYLERLKQNAWNWLVIVLPYAAAAVAFVTLRTIIQPAVADSSRGNTPMFIYFITQFRSWLHYWVLYFWPVELNADNLSFEFSRGLDDSRVIGALFVHLVLWAYAWFAGKKNRFVIFAIAWMYITVLPASSVFVLVEAVNEHRAYIPYMFLSLLATWWLFTLTTRFAAKIPAKTALGRNSAIGISAICIVLLGAGAYARNMVWQTDLSLWEDVYAKNPSSPRAMNVLGVSLLNSGNFARSTPMLEECHRVAPTYLPCIVHLSIAYANYREFGKGLALLEQGHVLDPNYVHINYHLGVYYKEYFGDFERARKHLQLAHDVSSGRFFQATLKLADIAFEEGKFQEGIHTAQSVLNLDQSNGDAWDAQARGLMLLGDLKSAMNIFSKLIEVSPQSPRYGLNMANISERTGDLKSAYDYFLKVAQAHPELVQAWAGVERLSLRVGDGAMNAQAKQKIAELKTSKKWIFLTSLFLLGEKPKQISPD